ncbi:peptidoglycan-binding domain-containing protein [Microbacterium sp.]|uniref:peptidoglycan-binding domain-containing protein n=1 Tax=Microbacterium sp. TaxID=51671 RepID=UPI0028127A2D|nr:peptidoglycan-binding domain-containing protein [Microbacterium sp.]
MSTSRRILFAALALLGAGGIALTIAAAAGFGFASADDEADDPPPATAEVTRQDLVASTEERGRLGYAEETTLRAGGGRVTWLAAVGSTVDRGGQLYRVDEQPTVLLIGGLPAYRTLESGMTGADVKQFEENLAALGYTGFDVDEEYTRNTAAAVKKWQKSLGLEQTGTVDPARVHYAAGPVVVTAHEARVGDDAGDLVVVAGSTRVVTVDLDLGDSRFAVAGAAVSVTVPDGTSFTGTITGTQPTVVDGDVEGEEKTVLRVTITPDDQAAVAALPSSSAKATFEADRREGVLVVPVTALLALTEGGYAVEAVDGEKTRLVAVDTGLFAGGLVEISGEDIAEGDRVVVPE